MKQNKVVCLTEVRLSKQLESPSLQMIVIDELQRVAAAEGTVDGRDAKPESTRQSSSFRRKRHDFPSLKNVLRCARIALKLTS